MIITNQPQGHANVIIVHYVNGVSITIAGSIEFGKWALMGFIWLHKEITCYNTSLCVEHMMTYC